jgi:hypothetical protein
MPARKVGTVERVVYAATPVSLVRLGAVSSG